MTETLKDFVAVWAKHHRPKAKEPLTVATFKMREYLAGKLAEERVKNGSKGSIRIETEHIQYKSSETVIVRALNNGRLEEAMYRFDKVGNGKIKVRC